MKFTSPHAARADRFDRARLPDPRVYYAAALDGLRDTGRAWQPVRCPFHDDRRPSMSVNFDTGGFVCHACGAKGGDVLAFHMLRHGMSFEQAARDLGAWAGPETTDDDRAARELARAKARAKAERAREQAREAEAQQRANASARAREIWCSAGPAPADHPYLVRKRLPPAGARFVETFEYSPAGVLRDCLLVPLHDIAGYVLNVQGIAPDGAKRFCAGAPTAGLFCMPRLRADGAWIERGSSPAAIGLAEGWASAVAHSLARKRPAVAAMSARNLPAVALALRQKWPKAELFVARDVDDAGTRGFGDVWAALSGSRDRRVDLETLRLRDDAPVLPGHDDVKDWADWWLHAQREACHA